MPRLKNIGIAVALLITIGVAIHEARQAARARNALLALQQQQTPGDDQIRQLQHERGVLVAQVSELRRAPDVAELSRLRKDVANLREELKDLPSNRAELLRQKLAQMPDKGIPELQFLTDKEWVNAAWDADLDSDDGIRLALRKLRDEATEKFLNQTRKALKAYAAANNDMLPADLFPLKGYYDMPVTDEMLQRYKLFQSGKLSEVTSDTLVRKQGYVDPDYDSNQEISINGGSGGSFNRIEGAINDAAREFALNHNFEAPTNPEQIAPYLKRTIDTGTIQKYLNVFVMDPPPAEVITLAPALKSYANDHNGQEPNNASDLLPYLITPEQQAAFQKLEGDRKGQRGH